MEPKKIIEYLNEIEKLEKDIQQNMTDDEWREEAKSQLMGSSYIKSKLLKKALGVFEDELHDSIQKKNKLRSSNKNFY
jgi:hypothetical protein